VNGYAENLADAEKNIHIHGIDPILPGGNGIVLDTELRSQLPLGQSALLSEIEEILCDFLLDGMLHYDSLSLRHSAYHRSKFRAIKKFYRDFVKMTKTVKKVRCYEEY
jgi:hypothetical protein